MKSIEEVIKQEKPFETENQRALINLIYTCNYVSDLMNQKFETYGISQKQYNVLRIIKGAKESVSTSYIRDRLIEKSADCSRIVTRLVSKKILKKERCENDSRLVSITLTIEGKKLMKKIKKDKELFQLPLEKLSEKECKQLNKILNKIR